MRRLVAKLWRNEDAVCHYYAAAEQRGEVPRRRNTHGTTAERYARALWNDGVKKGRLFSH
jgi:hypothetical protein